tara:strand:- start:617 stop:805 length:189 start_codon:yes stop_codon:yes gene_type:complete
VVLVTATLEDMDIGLMPRKLVITGLYTTLAAAVAVAQGRQAGTALIATHQPTGAMGAQESSG